MTNALAFIASQFSGKVFIASYDGCPFSSQTRRHNSTYSTTFSHQSNSLTKLIKNNIAFMSTLAAFFLAYPPKSFAASGFKLHSMHKSMHLMCTSYGSIMTSFDPNVSIICSYCIIAFFFSPNSSNKSAQFNLNKFLSPSSKIPSDPFSALLKQYMACLLFSKVNAISAILNHKATSVLLTCAAIE